MTINIDIQYTIRFDCIKIDFTQLGASESFLRIDVLSFANAILRKYEEVFEEPFYKRTLIGIIFEMNAHYSAYKALSVFPSSSLFESAKECDLENIYYVGDQNWQIYEGGWF